MHKWFKEQIKKYTSLYESRESASENESISFFSSDGKKPLKEIVEESSSSSSSSRISKRDYSEIELGISTDGDGVLFTQTGVTQLISTLSWREHIEQLKKSKVENKLMMVVMSKTTLAIGGQVTAGVIANAVLRNSPPSWAVYPVEFAVFLGLCFTLAGLTLRGRRQLLSTVMIKIGAMATASSVIISLASALQPAIAWTVAPLAFLLAAAAVAFAC